MRKNFFLFFVAALFFTSNLFAFQAFQSKEQMRELSNQFMAAIVALDVQGGFKLLQPYFRTSSPEEFAKLQIQTISQLDAYADKFGFPIGFEFIKEEKIGDFLIRYTYLEKYETSLLRWTFVFYKPKGEWLFNSLSWDENLQPVFDQ